MRDSSKKWYTTEVDFDLVEKRCTEYFERYGDGEVVHSITGDVIGKMPTHTNYDDVKIFISVDLLRDLSHKMSGNMRYSGGVAGNTVLPTVVSFVSSVGQFPFVPTLEHNNLLYVGTSHQLARIVWEEVDEVFE